MKKEQILQIPVLAKTMRAEDIAKLFNTTTGAVYRYARILRSRGEVITFIRNKPGVKARI